MEKCARPSCNCLLGVKKVEVEEKVYCSQECADNCTDEDCECKDCSCVTA
ncbi:metallothionein [Hazenella coriacea]|uniref:Metallothionein n=1 Tax=Hazenella coriacea TaxID=1179467 RepID=A0A4R3L5J2_9BACL|nr:metallothionein [Hazenella coriacea]TCS94963.1 metallothionein [Hazenella coriacea]